MSEVFTNATRDAEDLSKFVNQTSGTVTNRTGGVLTPLPVVEQQFSDAFDALTVVVAGDFETGATVTARNQVVLWPTSAGGDGREYRWAGALPKTVPAASTPAGTGGISDSAWVYTADVAFEQKLIAGDVQVNLKDGTAASPSLAFGTDTDTGIFKSAANKIGFSVGGVEAMTLHDNGRLTIGTDTPAAMVTATLDDGGILGSAFRARANWTGSTALPYQNNDVMFLETYNNVTSDSENKSWAISSSNAYNNIPAGVVDSGTRLGVYGWAVSVNVPGYTHAGTLTYQAGLMGRAGFFGKALESQSPAGAVIQNAIGVTGETYNDSPGTTVVRAKAVQALATGYTGTVEQNYAVYAQADGGTEVNYSFFGVSGEFFNLDRAHFGSFDPLSLPFYETSAKVISRMPNNSFEWGFPSGGGYASTIGSTALNGRPFIAFNAQFDTGNNFKTTGLQGHVVYGDNIGSLIFGALIDQNLANQAVTESFRITGGGDPKFARRPILTSLPPDSATAAGIAGQVAWDADYIYLCVADNTWKRVAIATW